MGEWRMKMKERKKNLFQQETLNEVISRIDTLQPTSARQWGQMDVAQMMAHCSGAMDMALGKLNLPRVFIGRLLGSFLKPMLTNDKRPPRNGHAPKELLVTVQRDFWCERAQLR